MELKVCVECGSKQLSPIMDTIEQNVEGKTLVIENIPAVQCDSCKEIYHSSKASQYIDKQIEVFKAEGFENKLKEVTKEKGLTQEQLGQLLGGLTKQRVSQIFKDNNLDVKTMYKLSKVMDEPIENLFTFNRVVERDNRFYIVHKD
ncbi:helix-turn-helix domain-containing protein [Paenibacillus chitinolyticus]|uniref:helix-turn-helix domain-containing protein n=1 Tax=Paenibacillus chitinolyticus TaxID=79263 RepID=UPI003556CE9B